MSVRVGGKIFEVTENVLSINYQNLRSMREIEGLENLSNLTGLNLSYNQIAKIEGLDQLANTHLKHLYLDNNKISRIEGLEKLTGLTGLSLCNNQITKIEGLDKLNHLSYIILRGNQIRKIEGLGHLELSGFNRIELEKNPIEWPKQLSPDASASEIITYCQRQQEVERIEVDGVRVAKLKKLVQVSVKLKRAEIGRYLGLEGDALFDRLVDWAAEFGFKLDDEFVTFEGGRKDDFLAALDKEFASWGTDGKK